MLVTFCTKIHQWQCQVGLVAQVCYSWPFAGKVTVISCVKKFFGLLLET